MTNDTANQRKSTSWIIRSKCTKEVVCETFSKTLVNSINTDKYEAIDILYYLYELNAKIKKES